MNEDAMKQFVEIIKKSQCIPPLGALAPIEIVVKLDEESVAALNNIAEAIEILAMSVQRRD